MREGTKLLLIILIYLGLLLYSCGTARSFAAPASKPS